jgi:hypothetical protein
MEWAGHLLAFTLVGCLPPVVACYSSKAHPFRITGIGRLNDGAVSLAEA